MKYISFERDHMELALLFPELIQHKEAAKSLRPSDKLLGAGFCSVEKSSFSSLPSVKAWGQSDGLRIGSRRSLDEAAIHFTLTLPTLKPAEAA